MDTRQKICGPQEARAEVARSKRDGRKTFAVLACCDPILPAHVARFEELANGDRLVLVIDTTQPTYLDLRARAELAASLVHVAVVVPGDRGILETLQADETTSLLEDERVWRNTFFRHVREKACESL